VGRVGVSLFKVFTLVNFNSGEQFVVVVLCLTCGSYLRFCWGSSGAPCFNSSVC
jgi:hypothetical protein